MSEPLDWQRLEDLFDQVSDIPRDERIGWIDRLEGENPDVVLRLRRMVAAHEGSGPLDKLISVPARDDILARLGSALEGRYTIEGLLGRGGMATVVRARELKHDRLVVIKVLDPGMAAAIGHHRFVDEVRIAAQLSHPHILALIDSGEVDGLRYYVMPYVGGETLRQRLSRDGALPMATALSLLRSIADALSHAHAAGVVHRDLKPENVLCVGEHPFLLDFGIAKADASRSRDTDPGHTIGTPGYMSPEQAAGQAVDHRADIFVWGLLAREVLTGEPGVAGAAEFDLLPEPLVDLIRRSTSIEPRLRPQSAGELVRALDEHMLVPARSRNWLMPAVAALLILGAGAWWWAEAGSPTIAVSGLVQPIAVAPLRDGTGDSTLSGLGRLAGDWIAQGLHESSGARVVAWPASRAAVEGAAAGQDAAALRDGTGAGTAVVGTIYRTGPDLSFQVELIDTRSGNVLVATAPVIVPADSAINGIRELRDRVMGALATQRDDRMAAGGAFARRPPSWQAYRIFDHALDDYYAYRYVAARDGMLQAWRTDTTFTAALVYAAYAAWNSTDRDIADSLVSAARERLSSLNEHHAAMTEHMAASLEGNTVRALAAARRAEHAAPGSRAAYNVALALMALNRPAEAAAQLEALDPDRGPMRGWPAFWSMRSYAAHLLGDHAGEFRFARTMAERHPGRRVTSVIMARALAASGDIAALDSLVAAHDAEPPDTYWSQGAMREVAGEELLAHGYPEAGERFLLDAERWLRRRLSVAYSDDHQYWLIGALYARQRWSEVEPEVDLLLADDPELLRSRGVKALLAARRGDTAMAAALLRSARPDQRGELLMFRARVAAVVGDHDAALVHLASAREAGVRSWHWIHTVAWSDFKSLASDPRFALIMGIAADGESDPPVRASVTRLQPGP